MKTKLLGILLVMVFVALAPSFVLAQDLGQPDTLIILTSRPEVGADDSTFIVEVWVWNDQRDVSPAYGFEWNFAGLTLDSAKASAEAAALYVQTFFYDGDIATSNANNRAIFGGLNFSGTGLAAKANRYLVATYYYSINPKWQVADEILVDTAAWDDSSDLFFLNPQSGEVWIPVYASGETDISVKDPSDIAGSNVLPDVYSLGQNYPNPFNPETTIEFTLEQPGSYTISIYNVIGQKVHEISEQGDSGFNSIPFNASNYPSGVYFYKLTSGSFTETKKMMLVK